jgi:hypothetical protein
MSGRSSRKGIKSLRLTKKFVRFERRSVIGTRLSIDHGNFTKHVPPFDDVGEELLPIG